MKIKLLYFTLLLFWHWSGSAQDSLKVTNPKTNPILFFEGSGGYSGGKSDGWTATLSLNYQYKKNLFTARYLGLVDLHLDPNQSYILFVPNYRQSETIDELSVLYGRRYIYDNKSISFSLGIGSVRQRKVIDPDESVYVWKENRGLGVPFEFNIKWFKRVKKPIMIYWFIPVGPPTSFGGSIGFKFAGTVGKTSYVGLGMTYSYGWHKNY